MKYFLALLLLLISFFTVKAQTINITSFQHSQRWLSIPAYVTEDSAKIVLFNITAAALSHRFNLPVNTKPTVITYRNINSFGKPVIKGPVSSNNAADLQVAVFSFITRATNGYDVHWIMEVKVEQHGKTIYSKETKHQLMNYNNSSDLLTKEEFIDLFALLFDELLENREALGSIITLGNKPEDKDSTLRANCERWTVDKNIELFGFAKPSFGPYSTLVAGQTDSTVIRKKSKGGAETSFEYSDGKLLLGQNKIVDKHITKFCSLLLSSGSDSVFSFFSINTISRKDKQTVLGFIFEGGSEGHNNSRYFDRNVKGFISSGNDSLKWSFSLSHYVNGEVGEGYLAYQQDSLILLTISLNGTRKEIAVTDIKGNYLAALIWGISSTEILLRKEIDPVYQKAIAALFAIMISIKNLPE